MEMSLVLNFLNTASEGDHDSEVINPMAEAILDSAFALPEKMSLLSELEKKALPYWIFRISHIQQAKRLLRQYFSDGNVVVFPTIADRCFFQSEVDIYLPLNQMPIRCSEVTVRSVQDWTWLNAMYVEEWDHQLRHGPTPSALLDGFLDLRLAQRFLDLHRKVQKAIYINYIGIPQDKIVVASIEVRTVLLNEYQDLRRFVVHDLLEGFDCVFSILLAV